MTSTLPALESPHRIGISISPNEANMAIIPIDEFGPLSFFSIETLKQFTYGRGYYEEEDFDLQKDSTRKEQILNLGYTSMQGKNQRPVLFVVLQNSVNLERNLLSALIEHKSWFSGQKLWLPLVKTNSKELTLEDDYKIIVSTINKFQKETHTEATIIISLPNNKAGIQLFDKIQLNEVTDNIFSKSLKITIDNKINCYFSDITLNGKDEIKRFYESNILEFKDNDSIDLISKIKKNDIIILKSSFYSNGIDSLKITALGIILEDYKNSSRILVDWRVKETSINIEGLNYYDPFIQKIYKYEITYLLSKLNTKDLQTLFYNFLNIKEKIAGLISDSTNGTDYLAIDKDVNAFAKVMAAKNFTPPLAISLFGKWGSGKSFFMQKLNDKINDLSRKNSFYCEGIVQIHFNAWSYMDSNLWASIVTRIFEELNIYISNNTPSDIERKIIGDKLTSQLSISKDKIDNLKNEKNVLFKQILKLKTQKRRLHQEIKSNIKKIQQESLWDVIENINKKFNVEDEINNSLEKNDSFGQSTDELKKIIPEKYWKDPQKTYQLAKSRYTFLKEFFRKDKILCNVLWLSLILVIIALTPLFLQLSYEKIKSFNFVIPQATLCLLVTLGAIWRRGEVVYNKLQPIISSFWKIKENYEAKINEAKANFEQEEKVLKLKIGKNKAEILLINEQIQKAEIIKTDLDFRINNALITETLYSFIDKRSNSNDYQKHLGLISIIRKDFEILNDLFVGHHSELDENNTNTVFKSKFTKPLERIILYIDDLDRCPEENVVQVLEAVNLLMAFPLFVVVVGVDSRWVKNALYKKHFLQFNNSNNQEEVAVSNYLEKIFQIPFHLKEAEDKNVKEMILNLAQHPVINNKTKISANQTLEIDKTEITNTNRVLDNDLIQTIDSNVDFQTEGEIEKSIENYDYNQENSNNEKFEPENLILTDNEIKLMQDMSGIVGNNPRCVKRFVNIFRVIKVHEEFDTFTQSYNQEIIAILFLIALPLGKYKKLAPSFEKFIDHDLNNFRQTKHYFQNKLDPYGVPYLKEELEPLKNELFKILSDETHETLLDLPTTLFSNHKKFISRFTFSQI